jgi:hypothetical protein
LAFGYKAVATDGAAYYVFHNVDSTAKSFTVDADLSAAVILVDGIKASLSPITVPTGVSVSGTTVTLQPLTSAILRK